MKKLITIDGATGEGGGQVVRTSLSLAAVTQTPVRIENIRAGRRKPGLLRQHLTGLRALAEITGGSVEGDALKSGTVVFRPGPIQAGSYHFAIGSAGSANLLLQTVLPALMHASAPSTVIVEGGTHNSMSPPFQFIEQSFAPLLRRFGPQLSLTLDRWGFYPAGGGQITATITPRQPVSPFHLRKTQDHELSVTAVVANLPGKIALREIRHICKKLMIPEARTQILTVPGPGPGNAVWITAAMESHSEIFTGFGEKRVTSERIAGRLVVALKRWRDQRVPVGDHLADQLLIPLALAGEGSFLTGPPTAHTLTNMAVIEQFLPVKFSASNRENKWAIQVESMPSCA